jgi:hypothetical protein
LEATVVTSLILRLSSLLQEQELCSYLHLEQQDAAKILTTLGFGEEQVHNLQKQHTHVLNKASWLNLANLPTLFRRPRTFS